MDIGHSCGMFGLYGGSYFQKTVLCVCVISNILGGCIIRLHFNCDSEGPAVGTGFTSILILSVSPNSIHSIHCDQFVTETTETKIYTIDLLSCKNNIII